MSIDDLNINQFESEFGPKKDSSKKDEEKLGTRGENHTNEENNLKLNDFKSSKYNVEYIDYLVCQYVDGELSLSEDDELRNLISKNEEAKRIFQSSIDIHLNIKQDNIIDYDKHYFDRTEEYLVSTLFAEGTDNSPNIISLPAEKQSWIVNNFPYLKTTINRIGLVAASLFIFFLSYISEIQVEKLTTPSLSNNLNNKENISSSDFFTSIESKKKSVDSKNVSALSIPIGVHKKSHSQMNELEHRFQMVSKNKAVVKQNLAMTKSFSTETKEKGNKASVISQKTVVEQVENSYSSVVEKTKKTATDLNLNVNVNDKIYNSLNSAPEIPNISDISDVPDMKLSNGGNFSLQSQMLSDIVKPHLNISSSMSSEITNSIFTPKNNANVTHYTQSIAFRLESGAEIGFELGYSDYNFDDKGIIIVNKETKSNTPGSNLKEITTLVIPVELRKNYSLYWAMGVLQKDIIEYKNFSLNGKVGFGFSNDGAISYLQLQTRYFILDNLAIFAGFNTRYASVQLPFYSTSSTTQSSTSLAFNYGVQFKF